MSSRHVGPIKDFALGIYDGPHATPKEASEGPIFLGIKNVTPQGTLDFSEIRHVSDQEYPKWTKRVVPRENDIVFSYEATLHRYALIPDGFRGCLGRRMALVRPDTTKVHPRFLHYYFLTPSWRAVVEANTISGATVDRVPLTKFPDFEVRLPALDVQTRIASILFAYDDLIENNRRRIHLLEQAARLLYKEWFVHLRFPGHEHVKIKDGVPEGWEKMKLFDIAAPTYGFAFKSALFSSEAEGLPVARIRDIPPGEAQTYTTEEAPKEKLLEDGDFVIGMDGDFHMNFWTGGKAWINQRVVRIQHTQDVSTAFLRYACEKQVQDFNATIVGTTVAHLGAKHLKLIEILVPPKGILYEAQGVLESIRSQIVSLSNQSKLASKARDLLLPRLMNGEVVV